MIADLFRLLAPVPGVRWVHALPGVAVWLFAAVWLGLVAPGPAEADNDSAMHVVRLLEILARGGWDGGLTLRDGAPGGYALHWTMPFDLVILALAAPLAPALGWAEAVRAAAPWSGAASGVLLVAATVWAVVPAGRRGLAVLAGVALAVSVPVVSYGRVGVGDHHLLIEAAMVAVVGATWRMAGRPGAAVPGLWAGALSALAVWTALEALPAAFVAGLVAAALPTLDPDRRARGALAFAAAFASASALALVLDPPRDFAAADRMAPVFALYALLNGAVVGAAALCRRLPRGRAVAVVAAVGAGAGLAWLSLFRMAWHAGRTFPDPAAEAFFWSNILEFLPPRWPGQALMLVGGGMLALAVAVWHAVRRCGAGRVAWIALAVAQAGLVAAGCLWARASLHAAALAAPLVAVGLARLMALELPLHLRLVRPLAVVAVLTAPPAAALLKSDAPPSARSSAACRVDTLARQLDVAGGGIVLADINLSVPLLLHSRSLRTVAGPYHGNGAGVTDVLRFAAAGDDEARAIAARRRAEWVLVCRDNTQPGALRDRLKAGQPPDWLEPVAVDGEAAADLRLYRVRRPAGPSGIAGLRDR